MEDTNTNIEAGTDTGLDGNPGAAADQTDLGQSGNLLDGDASPESKAPQAYRGLEELMEAAESDMGSLTVEERRRYIKAGKSGLKSEAEYEAKFGKAKTAGQPKDGEVEADPAQAKPGAKPTDKNKPAAPVAGDLSFLKEALPTIDITKPAEVVKSIKELQGHATRVSQRNADLEKFYPEIEAGLVERLKRGPEGLKEIFAQMDIPVPEWLGTSAPAGNNGRQQQQPDANQAQDFLEGLKDDDFVPASAVKGMVGTLVKQAVTEALAEVDKKYKPLQQSHEMIQGRIAEEAEANEKATTRKRGLSDAQIHSDFWGEYHPEERLTEKAEKIWSESIGPDGRILAQPHPEFPKLKTILEHRRREYLDKAHPAASYQHYLYERFHKSGKSKELAIAADKRAREALLTKQQQRVQPSLVNRGVNGGAAGMAGLRIASVEDVEAAYKNNPQAVRDWKNKAMGRKTKA